MTFGVRKRIMCLDYSNRDILTCWLISRLTKRFKIANEFNLILLSYFKKVWNEGIFANFNFTDKDVFKDVFILKVFS